jgi:catalase
MRQTINNGRSSYQPNSIGGGCPMQAKANMGGFVTDAEKLNGQKVRQRGEKFFDHFSQAALFWNSQSDPEKTHIIKALRFELAKSRHPKSDRGWSPFCASRQHASEACGRRSGNRSQSEIANPFEYGRTGGW